MKFPLKNEYTYPQIPIGSQVEVAGESLVRQRAERDFFFAEEAKDSYRQVYFRVDEETYIINRGPREATICTSKEIIWHVPLYILKDIDKEKEPNDLAFLIHPANVFPEKSSLKCRLWKTATVIKREMEKATGREYKITQESSRGKGLYLL